jgi:hypothetical protein
MRFLFYFLAAALAYPLSVAYEAYCRYYELSARHAAVRPPVVRATGRHTAAYLSAQVIRIGHQPGEVTT